MATLNLSQALRNEYAQLFQTCQIRPAAANEVTKWAQKVAANKQRYGAIGDPLGVPWYVVGIIHYRECSLDFTKHLHNGDPLTARTTNVPKGCPKTGTPPFTFEASAADALKLDGASGWADWSLSGTLYKLESFNGFGYRLYHPHVLSPYLWGKSNHYTQGGYPADNVWSDAYVNKQLGSAVLLRRMAELGAVTFDVDGAAITTDETPSLWTKFDGVTYDKGAAVIGMVSPLAKELQQTLNKIPGIHLKTDGRAGEHTSDALMRVAGHYLKGDPRIT